MKPVILLDSSAYFRLARPLHPLLKQAVEPGGPSLATVAALDQQCRRGAVFAGEHNWAALPEYVADRARCLRLGARERREVEISMSYMQAAALEQALAVAPVDLLTLAHAWALRAELVSDEKDLQTLARQYDVALLSTSMLLVRLRRGGRIDEQQLRAMDVFWGEMVTRRFTG